MMEIKRGGFLAALTLVLLTFCCCQTYALHDPPALPEAGNEGAEAETGPRFKVLAYNLRFGELASLEELAAFIKEHDPDLVALQEVDVRTHRPAAPHQNGLDFATELGYRTGMLSAYGKTIPHAGGYYGIAILSKFPLTNIQRMYLPKTEHGREQRAVLVADVEYQENTFITFASTHLDYTNTMERQVQVQALNEILLQRDYPIIVGGDFNAVPSSVEIREGMAAWQVVSDLSPTSPSSAPRNVIDYIFCYPAGSWTRIHAVNYPSGLSDHLPVFSTVELK